MPDRTDAQIGFVNAEGGLAFAELDVGFPQLLVGPVVDVAAKNVSAFTELGPIVPLRTGAPLQSESRWGGLILRQRDCVARRGAGISLQEPADLAFQYAPVQLALTLLDASAKGLHGISGDRIQQFEREAIGEEKYGQIRRQDLIRGRRMRLLHRIKRLEWQAEGSLGWGFFT